MSIFVHVKYLMLAPVLVYVNFFFPANNRNDKNVPKNQNGYFI